MVNSLTVNANPWQLVSRLALLHSIELRKFRAIPNWRTGIFLETCVCHSPICSAAEAAHRSHTRVCSVRSCQCKTSRSPVMAQIIPIGRLHRTTTAPNHYQQSESTTSSSGSSGIDIYGAEKYRALTSHSVLCRMPSALPLALCLY